MKYSTVEICKVSGLSKSKKKYEVTFKDLDGGRHDENLLPNAIGFWHYRSRIGKKKAFESLKKTMIDARVAEIEKIKENIVALQKLELNL